MVYSKILCFPQDETFGLHLRVTPSPRQLQMWLDGVISQHGLNQTNKKNFVWFNNQTKRIAGEGGGASASPKVKRAGGIWSARFKPAVSLWTPLVNTEYRHFKSVGLNGPVCIVLLYGNWVRFLRKSPPGETSHCTALYSLQTLWWFWLCMGKSTNQVSKFASCKNLVWPTSHTKSHHGMTTENKVAIWGRISLIRFLSRQINCKRLKHL